MSGIPAYAKDFTVEWLNGVLQERLNGNQVVACDARESDIPGQTAEIILMDVQYQRADPKLPTHLVAKVTSRNPLVIEQVIASYDQYRRETSFYNEFPDCGISVPTCLYSAHDPDKQEMVLLMEDLAPSVSPSWAASTEQVVTALAALPEFHGKWWNDPLLRNKDWMVQFDNVPFYTAAFSAAHASADVCRQLYDAPEVAIEAMAFCVANLDKVMAFIASRPYTFVHGDYHAKQMFFPTAQGGDFAVIDWQFPFVAQGAWDFARMLGMCMATKQRQAQEDDLIGQYLAGLASKGVSDYSKAEFEQDYKMGLLISQMIMMIAAADTDVHLFEKECADLDLDWRDVMFDRTERALEEQDILGMLKSL